MENQLTIDEIQLRKAALILRAINNKLRQELLKLLHQKGTITVKEIYTKLRLDQSATSQHLAILRKAGFVNAVRNGQSVNYSVNYERLKEVHQFAEAVLKQKNKSYCLLALPLPFRNEKNGWPRNNSIILDSISEFVSSHIIDSLLLNKISIIMSPFLL